MFSFIAKSIVRVFNSVVLTCIVVGMVVFGIIIGVYNFNTSMKELKAKTSNTADLAAISLNAPLWNYDENAVQGILTAILLDPDVVAIRVSSPENQPLKVIAEKKQQFASQVDFAELLKNSDYINSIAKIIHEKEQIGRIQIIASPTRVMAVIRDTTILISIFSLIIIFIFCGFIWFLGARIIQRPIDALRKSADYLADGNLNQDINTNRPDELGSLAVSFDKMRNAIRKKLTDLAILNSTGEKLASTHDQDTALETAIKVMNEKTNVAQGSIYLMNADKTLSLKACFPQTTEHPTVFQNSFKPGEGIAGQVAASAKVHFLPDITKARDYVSASPIDKPKALLCVPMMDDKEVFGVMNFIGNVGAVNFNKEDEGFALTIARMVVVTLKNIQMMAVIEEQNRTLEEKILERTAQLRQKTSDLNNMLQNMRQGIFTITAGSAVHAEYSAYLSEIFETKDIANRPALTLLFANSNVGGDALSQMTATLDSVIGEDRMLFDFNSHLLIHEYIKQFNGTRAKNLELDWNPVLDNDDRLDKVMVTVRDMTEIKALQAETEKQKEELDIIGQILSVSIDKFLEFVSTSYKFLDENKQLIETHQEKNLDVIAALFRNMHTIKGNSRTYGLTYITDRVHEAETTYNRLRSEENFLWNQSQLLAELQLARDCIVRYETVFKEKHAGFVGSRNDDLAQSLIENVATEVDNVNDQSEMSALRRSLLSIKHSINLVRTESVRDMLKGIIEGLPSLCQQLGKEMPLIDIRDQLIRTKKEVTPTMRNVFSHLFRNSIYHGIETSAQRVANGKSPQGTIHLEVWCNGDQVAFAYYDDGRGLALDEIYRKGIASSHILNSQKVTDEQIADLIFVSGLTTAEAVSNVSGRGVGMDAIKQMLKKYHGDVQLAFTEQPATNRYRQFKHVITLPAKYFIQTS